jgi:hypothetical protein
MRAARTHLTDAVLGLSLGDDDADLVRVLATEVGLAPLIIAGTDDLSQLRGVHVRLVVVDVARVALDAAVAVPALRARIRSLLSFREKLEGAFTGPAGREPSEAA